jgi:hypothetical protein
MRAPKSAVGCATITINSIRWYGHINQLRMPPENFEIYHSSGLAHACWLPRINEYTKTKIGMLAIYHVDRFPHVPASTAKTIRWRFRVMGSVVGG